MTTNHNSHELSRRTLLGLGAAVTAGVGLSAYGPRWLVTMPAHAAPQDWVLDAFGQKIAVEWDGKVVDDAQLQADVTTDQRYYNALQPPERDVYGGDIGSRGKRGLNRTGWFHVEQVDGKSVLVDPLGNQFFSLGLNSFASLSDTYTKVSGREQVYAWLPDRSDTGPFAAGWRTDAKEDYSFYVSNLVRKYGIPFDQGGWYARQVDRVRKWGFNTAGAFSTLVPGGPRIPYAAHLGAFPSYQIGSSGLPDIYHAGFAEELDANLATELANYRDDPYVIGYMFFNELPWASLRTQVTGSDANVVASKNVLLDQLQTTYASISEFNDAWDMDATSWSELVSMSFAPTTDAAVDDLDAFTVTFLDEFYRLFAETIRKHDPNHMVIGDRWATAVIADDKLQGQLATAAGKHLDVLTYNYYSWDLSLDRINNIYSNSGQTPVIITEFHYGEPTHGLTFAARMAANETEKGKLYRNYVEKAAASGMVVGTHWFSLLDQAGTGRFFQGFNGEAGAIGLTDVTDRPYKKMLTNVMEANYSVYNLMEGLRAPHEYPFTPAQGDRQSNKSTEIPFASSPPSIDGTLDSTWPSGPTLSLGTSDLVLGVAEDGVGAEFRLAWDQQNLYLHGTVNDPTPMLNSNHGFDIWNGDAIELFVGPENVDSGGGIQLKDSQLIISGQPQDADGTAEAFWYNNRTDQPPINAVVKPAPGGYTVAAAIPLAGLNFSSVTPPRELRFDIGFDDGTETGRQRQYLWNGVDGNAHNREKWGRATYVEEASSGEEGPQLPTDAQILTTATVVDGQIIVTGTGRPGAKYRAWIDGRALGVMTVHDTGQVRYPFDLPKDTAPGSHHVTVTRGQRVLDEQTVRLRPELRY